MTALHTFTERFPRRSRVLEKRLANFRNWLFSNDMAFNPRKCEFMGFRKTNKSKVQIRLEKSNSKKLVGHLKMITIVIIILILIANFQAK